MSKRRIGAYRTCEACGSTRVETTEYRSPKGGKLVTRRETGHNRGCPSAT